MFKRKPYNCTHSRWQDSQLQLNHVQAKTLKRLQILHRGFVLQLNHVQAKTAERSICHLWRKELQLNHVQAKTWRIRRAADDVKCVATQPCSSENIASWRYRIRRAKVATQPCSSENLLSKRICSLGSSVATQPCSNENRWERNWLKPTVQRLQLNHVQAKTTV